MQFWAGLVLAWGRALKTIGILSKTGLSGTDLAGQDYSDIEGIVLAMAKTTGYRLETL
jgi:hypothetical protein